MNDCGIDITEFPEIKKAYFDGNVIAPDMPPPKVTITENIDDGDGNCSAFGRKREVGIQVSGEFICCDPEGKVSAREALISQFSVPYGDFSVDDSEFNGAQVQNVDVSVSNYRDSVPYSVSLKWIDPDFPEEGAGEISNPSNRVQASEDDETITVSQTVSAQPPETRPGEEESCQCSVEVVKNWVLSQISETCPLPRTIRVPDSANLPEFYDEDEEEDSANCSYSITRTWRITKRPTSGDYGENISVQGCRTISESYTLEDGETVTKQDLSYNGSVKWESPSPPSIDCQEDEDSEYQTHSESLEQVRSVLDRVIAEIIEEVGREPSSTSKTVSEQMPYSGSYSLSFPAPPVEEPEEPPGDDGLSSVISHDYNATVSVGQSGEFKVSVSGNFSANPSNNCQTACEIIEDSWGDYKPASIARANLSALKAALGDLLPDLQGSCENPPKISPEPEESSVKSDKKTCAKHYSYVFHEKAEEEDDPDWNYSVSVSKPVNSYTITPLLNGGFCVMEGPEKEGNITVSVRKKEVCPDEEEGEDIDFDEKARRIAESILPGEDLFPSNNGGCLETKNGATNSSSFNKSFVFGGDSAAAAGSGVNINNGGSGATSSF